VIYVDVLPGEYDLCMGAEDRAFCQRCQLKGRRLVSDRVAESVKAVAAFVATVDTDMEADVGSHPVPHDDEVPVLGACATQDQVAW